MIATLLRPGGSCVGHPAVLGGARRVDDGLGDAHLETASRIPTATAVVGRTRLRAVLFAFSSLAGKQEVHKSFHLTTCAPDLLAIDSHHVKTRISQVRVSEVSEGIPSGRRGLQVNRNMRVALVATLGVGLTITGVAVSAAAGQETARTDSNLVKPAVQQGEDQFYTGDQIDEVWSAVVKNYPQPLPAGLKFPEAAPEFFHPEDGKDHLFQSGLPDLVAARYWRCAWLSESVEQVALGNSDLITKADSTIALYETLPSVASLVDVDTYEKQIQEIAETMGADAKQAELDVDCGGLWK